MTSTISVADSDAWLCCLVGKHAFRNAHQAQRSVNGPRRIMLQVQFISETPLSAYV